MSVQAVCPSPPSKNDCSNQTSRRSGTAGAGSCRTALNLHADTGGRRAPVQRADEVFAWRAAARVACCYSPNTRVGDGIGMSHWSVYPDKPGFKLFLLHSIDPRSPPPAPGLRGRSRCLYPSDHNLPRTPRT